MLRRVYSVGLFVNPAVGGLSFRFKGFVFANPMPEKSRTNAKRLGLR